MTKYKLPLILAITFTGILLVSIITLSILQTNTKPNLPNPDEIKIYKNSTSASDTYKKGTEDYNSIIQIYNSMFEKTYLAQINDRNILKNKISEDTFASPWVDANFETGVYVEFKFSTPKKYIIYRDGSSRRVDISSIIFNVSKDNKTNQLYIYYKLEEKKSSNNKNEVPTTNELAYPLVTQANTYELYKFIVTKD